jgi:hypothetical protein
LLVMSKLSHVPNNGPGARKRGTEETLTRCFTLPRLHEAVTLQACSYSCDMRTVSDRAADVVMLSM